MIGMLGSRSHLGGTLQALGLEVEVLHGKSSSNERPNQENQRIAGRILEALCDNYTNCVIICIEALQ